jgi:hypothetical protein
MISALVLSPSLVEGKSLPRASEAVARSLGALVRAAVEGVLRDVAIVGPEGDDLAVLADHAGCEFIETASTQQGLSQGLARMRGDIAFILEGGYAPPSGFIEEASDVLREGELFRGALLRCAPHSFITRLAPGLARPVGALVARSTLNGAAPRNLADVIRCAKIRRALNMRAMRLV